MGLRESAKPFWRGLWQGKSECRRFTWRSLRCLPTSFSPSSPTSSPRPLAPPIREWWALSDAYAPRFPPRRGVAQRPLIVIDEAHLIEDHETFEMIRLLLNFATLGPPDLSLLMVGGPEVLLNLPPGLADRISARCPLAPFEQPESAKYVLGRLKAAGSLEPLFDEAALQELHHASLGLPRRLNRLADLALLIAYAEDLPKPTGKTIATALEESALELATVSPGWPD